MKVRTGPHCQLGGSVPGEAGGMPDDRTGRRRQPLARCGTICQAPLGGWQRLTLWMRRSSAHLRRRPSSPPLVACLPGRRDDRTRSTRWGDPPYSRWWPMAGSWSETRLSSAAMAVRPRVEAHILWSQLSRAGRPRTTNLRDTSPPGRQRYGGRRTTCCVAYRWHRTTQIFRYDNCWPRLLRLELGHSQPPGRSPWTWLEAWYSASTGIAALCEVNAPSKWPA